jgi:acyl-CoA synthetase (AMP-forming)/AMP-acid ligase II
LEHWQRAIQNSINELPAIIMAEKGNHLPWDTLETHSFAPTGCTHGDMGRLDEDGYLFLVDRRSNMILSGGVNCRTGLSSFKCPRSIEFVDILPRQPDGKLQRRYVQQDCCRSDQVDTIGNPPN